MPWSIMISPAGKLPFGTPPFKELFIHFFPVSTAHPLENFPQIAAIHHLLHFANALVVTVVEAIHQLFAALHFCGLDFLDVCCSEGRRFLTKYVLSSAKCGYCERLIEIVGCAYENRIHTWIADYRFRRRSPRHIRWLLRPLNIIDGNTSP